MPIRKLLAGLFSLILLSYPAFADNWISAASDADAVYYVDTHSVSPVSDGNITFRAVVINKNPERLSPEGVPVKYEVRSMLGDCASRALIPENTVAYDLYDIPFIQSAINEWTKVEAGSSEDRMLSIACDAAGHSR